MIEEQKERIKKLQESVGKELLPVENESISESNTSDVVRVYYLKKMFVNNAPGCFSNNNPLPAPIRVLEFRDYTSKLEKYLKSIEYEDPKGRREISERNFGKFHSSLGALLIGKEKLRRT